MVISWEYVKSGNLRNAYLFILLEMVAFAKYEAIPVAEMCIYTRSFSTAVWRIKSLMDYTDLNYVNLGTKCRPLLVP